MENVDQVLNVIETAGWFAPVLFVLFHLIRPFVFVPVLAVCLLGGYIFGPVYGAAYSYVGLMSVSISFYILIGAFPKIRANLSRLKNKVLKGREDVNVMQLLILRVMPFMHFHVLSFYVMESSVSFKEYVEKSAIINLSPAIIYTAFGGLIHELHFVGVLVLASFLLLLFFFARSKNGSIPLQDFMDGRHGP
ncbi:TVP38/TMEM64 family protein [Shouchella shacheensis]|uniref:TVP38/TMEM64 family protein n=1 Tax=Shouchella shacheensis TaxID=1649580 RepID=UPI000740401B|nr:TVP38/TMEM64 family protein [Shouchella shacheensis]